MNHQTAIRIADFKESIFATMSKKALEGKAINLAQGFPDFDGAQWIRDFAAQAVQEGMNQYAPSAGLPLLRQNVSQYYQDFYHLKYSADQVTITNGATEAIFISLLATINPGDEVIVFEPFYDSYVASIKMAGGVAVPVTLHAPEFNFKEEELKKAFTQNTKMIILNSPHNPSGKIFSLHEMQKIASLAEQFNCLVLSDEVYEFLTYDQNKHIPFATLKGMYERTLTISSAGKTFGMTGWKIGWILANEKLTWAVRMVHQFNTFSVHQPAQWAFAKALEKLDHYLPEFRVLYQNKRDFFVAGLQKLGWKPIMPKGSYFVLCPIDHLTDKNDVDFCFELIDKIKVAAIPPSAFYLHSNDGKGLIRLCFAKNHSTLEQALNHLKQL
jgi:aspartate/methionine/tyrosine aminotransferase